MFRKLISRSRSLVPLVVTLPMMAVGLPVVAGSAVAEAAVVDFVVTKTADTADGVCDSDCSLREAVIAANATAGDDVIELPAGTYGLTIKGPPSVNPAYGDLDIEREQGTTTILGAGREVTVVDASGLRADPLPNPDRVFTVHFGAGLELVGITVTGGYTLNGSDQDGGGIWNWNGELTVTDSLVEGNVAAQDGGGIANSFGTAWIANTIIRDNDTDPPEYTTTGHGGGVYNSGTMTISASTIELNASDWGGGVASELWLEDYEPMMTIESSTIASNTARHGGGAANIATLPGAEQATMTLVDSEVVDNTADRDSSANEGGGLLNLGPDATMHVVDSTISGNLVTGFHSVHPKDGSGGGIHNRSGVVEVTGSTISDNEAVCEQLTGDNNECGRGGGVLNTDIGVVTISNSTISGNTATLLNRTPGDWTGGGVGGGVSHARYCNPVCKDPTTTIIDSTITGNDADAAGGIDNAYAHPLLTVTNSIISGNTGDLPGFEDCVGGFATGGHNLVGLGAGCPSNGTGDLTTTDALLGPLANNGGPTATHAVQAGSPAFDAGATVATVDQRGFARPQGTADDIGAFELRAIATPGLVSVLEGDSGSVVAEVPITLSFASADPVTVDWRTADILTNPTIAIGDVDYEADSGTVMFAPGDTEETVSITVFGDTIDEPPAFLGEWGVVVFSNPSPNATLDPSFFGLGIFIIVDDDPPPTITPGLALVEEGDTGNSVVVEVPVTLSNPSATEITVDWTTTDTPAAGIATEGVDFIAGSGTVTFAPGDVSETVSVTVIGDDLDEPPAYLGEWGIVRFTNSSANASIDPSFFGLGIVIIVDDDP